MKFICQHKKHLCRGQKKRRRGVGGGGRRGRRFQLSPGWRWGEEGVPLVEEGEEGWASCCWYNTNLNTCNRKKNTHSDSPVRARTQNQLGPGLNWSWHWYTSRTPEQDLNQTWAKTQVLYRHVRRWWSQEKMLLNMKFYIIKQFFLLQNILLYSNLLFYIILWNIIFYCILYYIIFYCIVLYIILHYITVLLLYYIILCYIILYYKI